jgi:hypothetical protein
MLQKPLNWHFFLLSQMWNYGFWILSCASSLFSFDKVVGSWKVMSNIWIIWVLIILNGGSFFCFLTRYQLNPNCYYHIVQTIKWLCLSTTVWGVGQIVWNSSSGWKLQIEKAFFQLQFSLLLFLLLQIIDKELVVVIYSF